jgi:hypothetical protein
MIIFHCSFLSHSAGMFILWGGVTNYYILLLSL